MTGETTSVQSIFFNSPEEAVAALTTAVRSGEAGDQIHRALGRMPEGAKNAVMAEVGNVAAGIMKLDVTDVFTAAWRKHSALRTAAEATLADPDTEQVVELATHSVSFTHEPSVEVHLGNLPVADISLQVQLQVDVRGALAVVKGGRLTAVRAGSADVSGTLTVVDHQVAERQVTLELPLTIRLGAGLPLAVAPPTP